MPKNIEDIVPSGRKSIRNISIPTRRPQPAKEIKTESDAEQVIIPRIVNEEYEEYTPRHSSSRKGGKWLAGGVALLLIAFLIFALQNSATLAYMPKTATLNFSNDTYAAYQSGTNGVLSYSVIKLSSEKSLSVPATGEETVNEKARGTVVIYNQQAVSQILVKTTRLETSDGKIYRIQNDVTVPAKGNLEVVAVADVAGATENIALSDFTLPGLKGSVRFDQVYGRSKTAMAGGFTGTRRKVSQADLAKAKSTLDAELKSELLSQARAQMPVDFILFPGLSSLSTELLPTENAGDENVNIKERGDLSAAIFKRGDLSQYLAMQKLGNQNVGSEVEITDFSKLTVTAVGGAPADFSKSNSIHMQLSGVADIRYITDETALAADLLGVDKSKVSLVLKKYPSISDASATIRPFWKSTFPTDVTKIKIERLTNG